MSNLRANPFRLYFIITGAELTWAVSAPLKGSTEGRKGPRLIHKPLFCLHSDYAQAALELEICQMYFFQNAVFMTVMNNIRTRRTYTFFHAILLTNLDYSWPCMEVLYHIGDFIRGGYS